MQEAHESNNYEKAEKLLESYLQGLFSNLFKMVRKEP